MPSSSSEPFEPSSEPFKPSLEPFERKSSQAPSLSSHMMPSSKPFESSSEPYGVNLQAFLAYAIPSCGFLIQISLKVGSSHYKRYKLDPLSPEVHLPHDICTVNISSTCDICGRTFAKPFNLRRHEREVHGHISNDHNVLYEYICCAPTPVYMHRSRMYTER